MRRIIRGVDKFTIKSGAPFIVQCNHAGGDRAHGAEEPMPVVSSHHGFGIVDSVIAPFTATNTSNSVGAGAGMPIHTVTTAGNQLLVTPSLMSIGQTGGGDRIRDVREPAPTTVSKAETCVVAPSLIQYHTEQTENVRAQGLGGPINTVDASNRYGLAAANLVEYYGNGNPLDLREPAHTVTSHDRDALTISHIAEFKGQDKGQSVTEPLRTITASAGEFGVVYTTIAKAVPDAELYRWPEIRVLLNKYCGYTLAEDEVILIWISGTAYFIADISLRMLTPRELYNAMGFPPDYKIDRDYMGNEYGKSKQVARCGNAVCPPMAEAVVRANLPEWCKSKITTMAEFEERIAV